VYYLIGDSYNAVSQQIKCEWKSSGPWAHIHGLVECLSVWERTSKTCNSQFFASVIKGLSLDV